MKAASLTLAALLLASAGCSAFGPRPDRSRFYTLTPLTDVADGDAGRTDLSLGLGPISLPEYLERPALVTRVAATEIQLSPHARWAEPLEEGIERTLRLNLAALLGPRRLVSHPWPPSQRPDYAVAIDITRFELDARGDALLGARWTLRDGRSGEVFAARETSLALAAGAGGTEAGVLALSRALAGLSHEIAAALRALVEAQ